MDDDPWADAAKPQPQPAAGPSTLHRPVASAPDEPRPDTGDEGDAGLGADDLLSGGQGGEDEVEDDAGPLDVGRDVADAQGTADLEEELDADDIAAVGETVHDPDAGATSDAQDMGPSEARTDKRVNVDDQPSAGAGDTTNAASPPASLPVNAVNADTAPNLALPPAPDIESAVEPESAGEQAVELAEAADEPAVESAVEPAVEPVVEHVVEPAVVDAVAAADDFDDFDDFGEPSAAAGDAAADDAFGDFGEFEEGAGGGAEDAGVVAGVLVEEPAERWSALKLRPVPPKSDMLAQLAELVDVDEGAWTDEPPRNAGLGQVLVDESSRETYAQLTTAPILKPLDWTRSRVRREHLISMGVPVNLDEVDSHRLSSLPPLRIMTTAAPGACDRASMPPPRSSSVDTRRNGAGARGEPEAGPSSAPGLGGSGPGQYGLGAKPVLDIARAEALCALEEDDLALLPLARLRQVQDDMARVSAQASAQLAWLLQLKDAQAQDAKTYNGMISELIANAAKAKAQSTAAGAGGVFRRASARRPMSMSGGATPRRVGSPGTFQ
ncbi:hypothetical protein Q5752_005370 [Cryptotrichosporon argae]